jgi:enamine deaminase RidA (YjgF/YER057c/UK114 family)
MTREEKLRVLGIELPELPKPLGSYVPFVQTGNLVFISGMLPLKEGKLTASGRLGESVSIEEAVLAARTATVNGLAVLRSALGTLERVKRCVKLSGFVASTDDFFDQPKVVNGASDLLFEVFEEEGRHARAAVGVPALPMNSPVEIEFIFEIR